MARAGLFVLLGAGCARKEPGEPPLPTPLPVLAPPAGAPAPEADRDSAVVETAFRDLLSYEGEDSPVRGPTRDVLFDPRPGRWLPQDGDILHDRDGDPLEGVSETEKSGAREAILNLQARPRSDGDEFTIRASDPRLYLRYPEDLDSSERLIAAHHPGFSSDGRVGIVCFHIPLGMHSGFGIFLLVREDGGWRVRVRQFVYYL